MDQGNGNNAATSYPEPGATILTLEELRRKNACGEKVIEVPEWGGRIRLRELNARDGVRIHDMARKEDVTVELELVLASVIGEDGARLDPEKDRAWLESQPTRLISRLARECSKLNGFGADEQAEIKADFTGGQKSD